jgi:transcriptional repressor NrdR
VLLTVLKKNGARELFDRDKLSIGIRKAVEKTSVTHQDVDRIVDELERELRGAESVEIESKRIGELVARRLQQIDKVAYIRFASVFKRFVDVEEFERELHKLL